MEIKLTYDEVANRAVSKNHQINKILSDCEIKSNFAKEETGELFEKMFNINASEIVVKEKSCKYYDLTNISDQLKQLEIHGKPVEVPKKATRSLSITSLTSDDNNRDYMAELKTYLKDVRDIIQSIKNSSIEAFDEDSCVSSVTTKNNKFLELVFFLQKLAREIVNIASTDNLTSDNYSFPSIDSNFISQLRDLSKCLDDMQQLVNNKNPITNLEKNQNLKLEYTPMINSILEAIENNSY